MVHALARRQSAWDYTTAKREKGEFVLGLICLRRHVQRSYRIDARNGDRLGSGGYDYHDAPGYLLEGGGPGRRAVGIAALRYRTT